VAKVVDALVYGSLGLAAYLRDSAPSFVDLFVARGRREFDGARRAVESRLSGCDRSPVARRLTDGLGRVVTQAGDVVTQAADVVSAFAGTSAAPRTSTAPTATFPEVAPDGAPPTRGARPGSGTDPAIDLPTDWPTDLPIPGYDDLSASQVVPRLDGLDRAALEAVRAHEVGHRGRRTIITKIDHLLA
jgi:hypothetical protein